MYKLRKRQKAVWETPKRGADLAFKAVSCGFVFDKLRFLIYHIIINIIGYHRRKFSAALAEPDIILLCCAYCCAEAERGEAYE